ncbi:MAG: 23S rRNA (adenine(2503)-C(2))-methyltransferase RlmN [Bacteroidales bacterium]
MEKFELLGKRLPELKAWVHEAGLPAFTAGQLFDWMYKKRVFHFEEMSNLSKKTRQYLQEHANIYHKEPILSAKALDGTVKYLFSSFNGGTIEAVYIPDRTRATLCVSSQVGCKMACSFCMTGRMGFTAQLQAEEILNQVLAIPESLELTNVVFMGMGEPLDNVDEVLRACDTLVAEEALAWSPKRVTVSSIGVLPALDRFLRESKCHVAISLHTADSEQRASWMPTEKAWPIAEVVERLKQEDFSGQRRLSFEYIVFKGLNDDRAHADALLQLIKGLECRVNLIRFHKIPNTPFATTNESTIQAFAEYMNSKSVITTIRRSRGEDIQAACGLLSTQQRKK